MVKVMNNLECIHYAPIFCQIDVFHWKMIDYFRS